MRTARKIIGILGGTFDPVHLGHLHLAKEALKQAELTEIRFIPCYQSPHKKMPVATGKQRLVMLKFATKPYKNFYVDDRELQRKNTSYTIDTLKSLRQEIGKQQPICLIMSMDAFAKFNYWHKWQEITKLCHIIVADRPDSQPITDTETKILLKEKQIFKAAQLKTAPAGYILFINISPNPISATKIRAAIKACKNINSMVTKEVSQYIEQHKIYL